MTKATRVTDRRLIVPGLIIAIAVFGLCSVFVAKSGVWIRYRIEPATIGNTPLHEALIENAPLERIAQVIDANPSLINAIDSYAGRPVDLAVENLQLLELLLQRGASPNGPIQGIMNPFSGSPLIYAATRVGDVNLVRLLLKYGADPSATSKEGDTAMQVAQQLGRTEIARILNEAIRNSAENADSM
jgi:ankyrin repeat protein